MVSITAEGPPVPSGLTPPTLATEGTRDLYLLDHQGAVIYLHNAVTVDNSPAHPPISSPAGSAPIK